MDRHWDSGAGKQLGQAVILTQSLDGLGFHLVATVIDEFGPLFLRELQDVLIHKPSFQQSHGLLGGLVPSGWSKLCVSCSCLWASPLPLTTLLFE